MPRWLFVWAGLLVSLVVIGGASAGESPSGSITDPQPNETFLLQPFDDGLRVPVSFHADCGVQAPWYVVVVITADTGKKTPTGTMFAPAGSSTFDGTAEFALTLDPGRDSETYTATVEVHCGKDITTSGGETFTICRGALTVSDTEKNAIKASEGFSPTLYNDPAKGRNCTIGWGHKVHDGPCQCKSDFEVPCSNDAEKPFSGGPISQQRAQRLFDADLDKTENLIRKATTIVKGSGLPLTHCQFDALTDFIFNVGITHQVKTKNGKKKTVEYTFYTDLKNGDYADIPAEMRKFRIPASIAKRHEQDADMFANPDCPC